MWTGLMESSTFPNYCLAKGQMCPVLYPIHLRSNRVQVYCMDLIEGIVGTQSMPLNGWVVSCIKLFRPPAVKRERPVYHSSLFGRQAYCKSCQMYGVSYSNKRSQFKGSSGLPTSSYRYSRVPKARLGYWFHPIAEGFGIEVWFLYIHFHTSPGSPSAKVRFHLAL